MLRCLVCCLHLLPRLEENVAAVIKDCARAVGLHLAEEDIDICPQLSARNKYHLPSIIVKLTRRSLKERVLKALENEEVEVISHWLKIRVMDLTLKSIFHHRMSLYIIKRDACGKIGMLSTFGRRIAT